MQYYYMCSLCVKVFFVDPEGRSCETTAAGRFPKRRLGLLSPQLGFERADRTVSKGAHFAGVLGARQKLRHVLVFGSVGRPPFRSGVPAIISNRHIDAVVN
jgi:hypothetical protein